jgi:hypothetical protein
MKYMLLLVIFAIVLIGCDKIIDDNTSEIPICTTEWNPVCGVDGVTYGNPCIAGNTEIAYHGECVDDSFVEIPKYCSSWFDGCNTCTVSDGEIGGCTRIYCEVYQEPRCLSYEIPDNCTMWFDGCNSCSVEQGKLTICTLMYCETYDTPECIGYS